MSAIAKHKGYPIEYDYDRKKWVYCDNKECIDDVELPCTKCGELGTPDGYDACWGRLEEVEQACCGHGNIEDAYIIFENGDELRGQEAIDYVNHKKNDGNYQIN